MIKNYAVEIFFGENRVGTGVLYAKRQFAHAYIFTVAHIFNDIKSADAFGVAINFNIEGCPEDPQKYTCRIISPGKEINECRVCTLEGYKPEESDSPHDGAVIEIPYKRWMGDANYNFGEASTGARLSGWGYPLRFKGECKRFDCIIETVAGDARGREKKGRYKEDYVAKYDIQKYISLDDPDTSFLDGYSGMGLFKESGDELRLVGLFCRDQRENTSSIYLTDAQRLHALMMSMIKKKPYVFPIVNYVPFDVIEEDPDRRENEKLNVVLNEIWKECNDYFRIICGPMWCGKSYGIGLWLRCIGGDFVIHDWDKIMDCLNGDDLSVFRNSVFLIDQLERFFSMSEKDKLYLGSEQEYQKREDGRLNTSEKRRLIRKIIEKEGSLKINRITILLICRSNFFLDVALQLDKDKNKIFRKKVIYCKALDKVEWKKVIDFYKAEYPPYFENVPFVKKQLQWIAFFRNPQFWPQKDEEEIKYEFRLYEKITANIGRNKLIKEDEAIIFLWYDSEKDQVKKSLSKYLLDPFDDCNNEYRKWEGLNDIIFWLYPFKVNDKLEVKLDDDTLYCYLIAKGLFELISNEDIIAFKNSIRTLRDRYQYNEHNISGTLILKIRAFLRLFFENDPGEETKTKDRIIQSQDKDLEEWLFKKSEEEIEFDHLIQVMIKTSSKNVVELKKNMFFYFKIFNHLDLPYNYDIFNSVQNKETRDFYSGYQNEEENVKSLALTKRGEINEV